MGRKKYIEADIVIAGGGPGGCEIARRFSLAGKRAVLIEKGGYGTRMLGTLIGAASRLEVRPKISSMPVLSTIEGAAIPLCSGVGGGTLLYCGSAFLPEREFWLQQGIDLPRSIIDEGVRETRVSETPDEFIGAGSKRLQRAALELGFPWEPLKRHIDFNRCVPGCDRCTYGCSRGAKWTGLEYAEEAVRHGARILDRCRVEGLLVEGGRCGGAVARDMFGGRYEVRAPLTVCSAGGIGTALLLRGAGIEGAGTTFAGDPTGFTFGFLAGERGNSHEHNMPMGYKDRDNGVLFSSMLAPQVAWIFQVLGGLFRRSPGRIFSYRTALGLFVKVSDQDRGSILKNGAITKTFTDRDRERIRYGQSINEKILIRAGCDPDSICHTELTLGHPGQTAPLGRVLKSTLETEIQSLYCCDTSVMPEAPGMPPALSVVVLAKYLSGILLDNS
ncbi:MAG: GMC family oxidoreductase [Spirochaetes bacterium]|nr:GMC family oxidoreductase [Spirochaetota bacterium]